MDSTICCDDEQLDLEYLKILRLMKPYITCIMNNDYVQLIRYWLEKLSSSDFSNKLVRNNYLKELGRQVEDGVLDIPFTELPPEGPLQSYEDIRHCGENESQDMVIEIRSAPTYLKTQTCLNLPEKHVSEPSNFKHLQRVYNEKCDFIKTKMERVQKYSEDIQNNLKRRVGKLESNSKLSQIVRERKLYHSTYSLKNDYKQHMIERYDAPKMYQNAFECQSNDSSWLDLTDASNTNITEWGSGDKELVELKRRNNSMYRLKDFYELKIANLLNIIEEIKQENLLLKEETKKKDKELQMRNAQAETSINNLTSEINILKGRLQELMDIKLALQSSHYVVAKEWQEHISKLEKKMQVLQKENNELKTTVTFLDKKLSFAQNKNSNTLRKQMTTLHEKETALLKELNKNTEAHLKAQFSQKALAKEKEFEESLKMIRENCENRILEIECKFKDDYEIKMKENEHLQNLVNELHNRIKRKEEELINTATLENSGEKINYLQKCIMKMDKLYRRGEKEYTKQIHKLKKEIEYKDRTMQVHLSAQKAELIAQTARMRQIEIDNTVNKLEEYYKSILQQQQSEAITAREQYEKTLHNLKAELDSYKYT